MKTVISIWNSGGKGKTASIRAFADLLLKAYPGFKIIHAKTPIIPFKGDFRLIVEINGKIVGVESQGDPNTNLGGRLIELSDKFYCDIIICSSRTRGETVDAVLNLQNNRSFEIIWTSTYQVLDMAKHKLMNEIKGKHILDLLNIAGIL